MLRKFHQAPGPGILIIGKYRDDFVGGPVIYGLPKRRRKSIGYCPEGQLRHNE